MAELLVKYKKKFFSYQQICCITYITEDLSNTKNLRKIQIGNNLDHLNPSAGDQTTFIINQQTNCITDLNWP